MTPKSGASTAPNTLTNTVMALGLSTKIHGHTATASTEVMRPPRLKSTCLGNRLAKS